MAGVKKVFSVSDVKERVISYLDQLLMKWIVREGKDMFNLTANAQEISRGICMDLDMEMRKIGIAITGFVISSVSYPESVQAMINKAASQSMVGDVGRYQQMNMAEAMGQPGRGGSMAADMAGMQMGMMMGQQMAQQMSSAAQNMNGSMSGTNGSAQGMGAAAPGGNWSAAGVTGSGVNFCPNCGAKASGARFCPNCGQKLQ